MVKESIIQEFTVSYRYPVHFTTGLFATENRLLADFFASQAAATTPKVLVVVDDGVVAAHGQLATDIQQYFSSMLGVTLVGEQVVVPGGEACKNDDAVVDRIIDAVDRHGVDRHSYIIAI